MKKLLLLTLLFAIIGSINAQTFTTELFKSGFNNPINLQNAGDERLFVVEQAGRIKILNPDASVNSQLFLDLTSIVSSGGERGLLGLAFHPDYANNGYFYVDYSNSAGNNQISRFSVSTTNPNVADPNSEFPLLTINQPFSNHNGGCIAFGPDGYLYISSGDGGSGGDPGNRAQNNTLLLGKLLRIDIDNTSGNLNYSIPTDNPFADDTSNLRKEIWAFGLRNAWKFSFDFTANNIWIGDVGQGSWEEINRQPIASAGLNYGWRCYEGNQAFNTTGCPPPADLIFPIGEYPQVGGNCSSVTGGYVYRGSIYSDIAGLYFFADYCRGFIGTITADGTLVNHGNFNNGNWSSFGEDINKELYIVNAGGSIYKIAGGVLATEENILQNSISMVPNPSSGSVSLRIQNDALNSIQIIDLKGSILYSEENINASEKNLDISNFSNGLYFVRLVTESGKTAVQKLLKK